MTATVTPGRSPGDHVCPQKGLGGVLIRSHRIDATVGVENGRTDHTQRKNDETR